jgi:hypothetical protein
MMKMRIPIKYLGQLPEEQIPPAKLIFFKNGFVLGELKRRGKWFCKFSIRPPTTAEMRNITDLANKGWEIDPEFALFVQRLIEAQGEYALKWLRENAVVAGLRLPRKNVIAQRRLIEARVAVASCEDLDKRKVAEKKLEERDREYA